MIITRADRSDAAEILVLQKVAYLSEAAIYNDYAIPPLTQTLEELADSFSRNTVLKAVEDGKIVGSVNGRMSKGRCLIGRLMVHPERQGRGIGAALMQAVEAAFPEASCYRLFTGERSDSNIRLYQKLGYRIFDRKEIPGSFAIVFMEKPAEHLP
ncbi:GNAT family N-acetyltransferase [Geomonas sp. Red69]|uniref:GNAT family N-acetyltransferase n=1 Tax=Geomonas diazotrophica TaxID=2843197 RepID=A0ABX8JMF5_9BACT|nr:MULTISPECIES: GNAT family N-acetyltransferase [Geomonas]MBU5637255.1 GNAT family N-acetyltransferase [Geomonas diazotrophica]QWV99548.1 GNAT family N-acetyltransferase [Geomonas nitrogeniifigens]QXE88723.1 GNAT family N-acetyltransferase [Geomonas nitrogeniifigens]